MPELNSSFIFQTFWAMTIFLHLSCHRSPCDLLWWILLVQCISVHGPQPSRHQPDSSESQHCSWVVRSMLWVGLCREGVGGWWRWSMLRQESELLHPPSLNPPVPSPQGARWALPSSCTTPVRYPRLLPGFYISRLIIDPKSMKEDHEP